MQSQNISQFVETDISADVDEQNATIIVFSKQNYVSMLLCQES